MSKQLLIDHSFFHPISPLNESSVSKAGNMIVVGMVQACDKPNANKRVYPYDVLYPQVEKYINGPISENRALGELDHPECLRPSAMILTDNGWRHLKSVNVGDRVMTLNTDINMCEWNNVERLINKPYKGKAIRFKGRGIDTVVTPNHRFILRDRYGNYEEVTAQEIHDAGNEYAHHQIPKSLGDWQGNSIDTYTIPSYEYGKSTRVPKVYREKYKNQIIVNAKDWYSFVGFYLAEGGVKKNGGLVAISQNKGEKANAFIQLLERLSPQVNWSIREKGEKGLVFTTSDKRLTQYLKRFGTIYTKSIPKEYKESSSELLEPLYEWFKLGDGTDVTCEGHTRTSVFSTSHQLMQDFNEILLKINRQGDIKEQITTEDYKYANHTILAKNKKPLYRLYTKKSAGISLDRRFLTIEEVDYDDTVHCVTVKNGNFYCKDQGLSFLSGNSSVINLKNVSHNILELWWKGKDLFGKVEILPTPSGNILKQLFLNNITVGISSRALGSTSPIGEGLVKVEEDLDIICWDFVSQPSTYGAYMKPAIGVGVNESIDYTAQKPSKYQLSNGIMRDLICEMSGVCCLS